MQLDIEDEKLDIEKNELEMRRLESLINERQQFYNDKRRHLQEIQEKIQISHSLQDKIAASLNAKIREEELRECER